MIDAHCHLMDINNAEFSGLEAIANCGYDLNSSRKAIEMKKALRGVVLYANVGVGPQKCMETSVMQRVAEVENLAREYAKDINAIGEVGLDYHWGDTPEKRERQGKAFEAFIALAQELEKPLVIHSRETTSECIRKIDQMKFEYGVMFHFFSGNASEAKEIVDRGWLISLPPLRGGRVAIARECDLEALVAETDAPYVGKTPLDVRKAIMMIAETKEMSFEEVEKETSKNAREFFE